MDIYAPLRPVSLDMQVPIPKLVSQSALSPHGLKRCFFLGGGGKEDMRRPHAEQGVRHDEIATKD